MPLRHLCLVACLLALRPAWFLTLGPDVSLDGVLDGCVAFNDFCVAGTCDDSSLHLPTWELSLVMYHLPHQDELGCESSLFHPKTMQGWGLGHLDTSFFDPYLAEHESVVASVGQGNDETWILFDSGAAANSCPPDFAPEFPLLQLDKRAPPLKSISGQTLNIYGRKLVAFEIKGKRLWLNFYVCDVPYSVISFARLLQQGCKATLSSEGSRLEGPSGESMPVVRYGSLLFLCPKLVSFDPGDYLIGMPKRVTRVLLLRKVIYSGAKLANSRMPFRRWKKDFGLAVTRSPTNTLWPHLTVFSRLAHFGDALRRSICAKPCWSHLRLHLGALKVPARKQTTLFFRPWVLVLLRRGCSHVRSVTLQNFRMTDLMARKSYSRKPWSTFMKWSKSRRRALLLMCLSRMTWTLRNLPKVC